MNPTFDEIIKTPEAIASNNIKGEPSLGEVKIIQVLEVGMRFGTQETMVQVQHLMQIYLMEYKALFM